MTMNNNFYPAGVPSEKDLENLANSMFNDFDPVKCGNGIGQMATTGDTSVLNDAYGKLENYFGGANPYAEIANELNRGYSEADTYLNSAGAYINSAESYANSYTGSANSAGGYSPIVVSQSGADNLAQGTSLAQFANPKSNSETSKLRDIVIGTKTLSQIRADFPILQEKINGYPLVWFDNGATTQRPRQVIDRLKYYYEHENSNVHRGAHELAARSTDAYENARQTVANFIGAQSKNEIVFVRGTTEGINLVAHSYVKPLLKPGDEIILTILEHHANIVPWQLVAQETGAVIKVAPVDKTGQIIISEYEKLFTPRTKFVSAAHVSNALGTVTPIAEMIAIAHANGVKILIDGAQSIAHIPVNVTALDADFFVFSGHKIYAPTGIGAVYGKYDLLEAARPYHGGGNMIKDVTFERTIYNPAPNKFEAGTGSIADAVGLGAALEYLTAVGMDAVNRHEHNLLVYAMEEMRKIRGLHLIGTATDKASVLSFVLDGVDNETVGATLNSLGIAVRMGHHCAQPILRSFGLEGTVRPTLALYNSFEDVDALVNGIRAIAH